MARLYRPAIPLEVRCRVALRQLNVGGADVLIRNQRLLRGGLTSYLDDLLSRLAVALGCQRKDLRLDHHPALENRMKRTVHRVERGELRTFHEYSPDANDPEHLLYRTAHDHHIKTNVRGDGAQFADNVIAKRERKRQKKKTKRKRPAWPSRPLRSRNTFQHRP